LLWGEPGREFDFGVLVCGDGRRLGSGRWVPAAGSRPLGSGRWVPTAGFRLLSSGCVPAGCGVNLAACQWGVRGVVWGLPEDCVIALFRKEGRAGGGSATGKRSFCNHGQRLE
jgi:hypothetical protein